MKNVLGVFFAALMVMPLAAENPLWTILPDRVVQGSSVALAHNPQALSSNASGSLKTWKLSADLQGLPRFQSPGSPLLAALWNLSLEEVLKNRIDSGTQAGALSAGALWPGVWTRDASYAAHLSLAWLFPDAVKASLRAKVDALGRIVQDTGTGGSWPVSTDRVVWALAGRELDRVTGDAGWRAEAYPILARSAKADRAVAFDDESQLYWGETSFMDWREQTYPAWMQPADIFESPALGTNALHYGLLATLQAWAPSVGRSEAETAEWKARGQALGRSIDATFWRPSQGNYAMYRYPLSLGGRLSNRSDTLGNALVILEGIAGKDRGVQVAQSLPLEAYGPPIIYPQLAHTGPYHNKAVWPFVTAYYGWAAKTAGNSGAAVFALEANLRAAALFLTNQENLVHDNGEAKGTSVNSERQLWSAAGLLSGHLRTLLGLDINDEGLALAPLVPSWVKGPLSITGLPWQGRTLGVTVNGKGSRVLSLTLDGRSLDPKLRLKPEALGPQGTKVNLVVTLANDALPARPAFADFSAKGPWDATSLTLVNGPDGTNTLTWKTRTGVALSQVTANGQVLGQTKGNEMVLPAAVSPLTAYSVTTINEAGWPATMAEPLFLAPQRVTVTLADTDLGASLGDRKTFALTVPRTGRWLIRFHYTNTSGPIATDNKAAVRDLSVDGGPSVGAIVFPQRGYNSNNRGWSSGRVLSLAAGEHELALTFGPDDVNMDATVNRALVDGFEALPLE